MVLSGISKILERKNENPKSKNSYSNLENYVIEERNRQMAAKA
jgi:hypothetical protein